MVFIWWCNATTTQAVYVDLPDSGTKCVSEDIRNNVLVHADYILVSFQENSYFNHGSTISIKVSISLILIWVMIHNLMLEITYVHLFSSMVQI